MEILVFEIAHNNYAINIHDVNEILNMAKLGQYSKSHPLSVGIFNLRGELLPVIDFTALVGHSRASPPPPLNADEPALSAYSKRTRLLVVTCHAQPLAVVIDNIKGVVEVDDTEACLSRTNEPSTENEHNLPSHFSKILPHDNTYFHLVDMRHLLSPQQISQLRLSEGLS